MAIKEPFFVHVSSHPTDKGSEYSVSLPISVVKKEQFIALLALVFESFYEEIVFLSREMQEEQVRLFRQERELKRPVFERSFSYGPFFAFIFFEGTLPTISVAAATARNDHA